MLYSATRTPIFTCTPPNKLHPDWKENVPPLNNPPPPPHSTKITAGKPLDHAYKSENLELVQAGCVNLARHISNARRYGVPVVVALNRFATDTDAELDVVRQEALAAGGWGGVCGCVGGGGLGANR